MSVKSLSTATVIVNNVPIAIVPNSLKFTEGFGEYSIRAGSAGGGSVETVFSKNAEQQISKCSWEMFPTEENISLCRTWKNNENANTLQILEGDTKRAFTNAVLANDYEVNVAVDGTISLEWVSDAAS